MRIFLLVGASIALCGCVVGPNYRLPDKAMVNSAGAKGTLNGAGAFSQEGLPAFWWRLYEDPVLDKLIENAFAQNTDLRMADANLERSQALVKEAKSLRQVSLTFDGGAAYGQLSGEQYLLPIRPPVGKYYDLNLTAGYDLDLFGGIRRGIEAAKADDEAVEAARDLVKVNVAAETARAYADICGAGLQLAAAQQSLRLQQESLALTRRLVQNGRAIDLDVTRSQQLVDQLSSVIPTIEASQRNASYRLVTLTGRPPSEIDVSLETCATPPRLRQPLPIGDGAALLKRRPDIRAAERQLAAATAEIGVVTAQLYPDIQVGASAGSTGSMTDFLQAPTNLWNIAGLVHWQANQSAARARIEGANAVAKGSLAHFDGVVLTALRDTEVSLNVYQHDLQRESSTQAARDDAAKAVQESLRLQTTGRATQLSIIDAERTLASAEQQLAQVEAGISEEQISVFLALGGGWQETAP